MWYISIIMLLIYDLSSSVFFFITINFNLIGRAWPPLLQAPYTLIKIQKEKLKVLQQFFIIIITPNIWVQQVILKRSSKPPFTAIKNLGPIQNTDQSRKPNRLRNPSWRGDGSISDNSHPVRCSITSQTVTSRWNLFSNFSRLVQERQGENILPRKQVSVLLLPLAFWILHRT